MFESHAGVSPNLLGIAKHPTVEDKAQAYAYKATGYELSDFFNLDKQIPTNDTKRLTKAYSDDLHEPTIGSLSVGSKPVSAPETPISIDYLTEQHCKDTDTIGKLEQQLKESEKERYEALQRGDNWRNKYRFADDELEKAKVKNDAEVRNLNYEITLLNKALEAHVGDEQLLLLTMKKAVSFAERVVAE